MEISNLQELKAAAEKLKGTWFNRFSRSVVGIGLEAVCAISAIAYMWAAGWLSLRGPEVAMRYVRVHANDKTWTAIFSVDKNAAIVLLMSISLMVAGSLLLFAFARYLASVSNERRLALELCDAIAKLKEPERKADGPSNCECGAPYSSPKAAPHTSRARAS